MRWGLIALALAASPAGAQTLQADYDAAQALLAKSDFAAAAAKFEAVLGRMGKQAANPASRTAATIRTQYATALMGNGQPEEAAALFEKALPGFAGPSADDRKNLAVTLSGLARARESTFDYAGAGDAYRRALALRAFEPGDTETVGAQFGLGRVSMFSDPAGARVAMDAALPHVLSIYAANKDKVGEAYALRGRIELNSGKPAVAREWFTKALTTAGGLTNRVSLSDIRIRGDLALASFALGEQEAARKYLTMTGAGHMNNKQPERGADMPPPVCGEDDVRPTDSAIIEFSIMTDGRTTGITPIYVSRPGIETAFAKAVAGWSWRPEDVAGLPTFWRHAMRLEMRCSTQQPVPSLTASLKLAVQKWLAQAGAVPFEDGRAVAISRATFTAELARREVASGATSIQLMPLLLGLSQNETVDPKSRLDYLVRALAIAERNAPPPDVRAFLAIGMAEWAPGRLRRQSYLRTQRTYASRDISELATQLKAGGAASAHALAAVQAWRGSAYEQSGDTATAEQLYDEVVKTPNSALPEGDPIRSFALLRLATRAAQQKRMEEAQRYYQATGLSAEQCALVDVRPVRTGGTVSTSDFPNEALRWGFDGWVVMGYDIDSGGKASNVRTLLAYPPFIFGPATEKAVARFRFEPVFRGGASVGCTGRTQTVNYRGQF